MPPPSEIAAQGAALAQRVNFDFDSSTVSAIGEKLKQKFLDMQVLSTLLVGAPTCRL
jgi:hypothetical protein